MYIVYNFNVLPGTGKGKNESDLQCEENEGNQPNGKRMATQPQKKYEKYSFLNCILCLTIQ